MYNAQITRQNKGAFMLLIDQSGSMDETCVFNGRNTTKAQAVASIANSLIEEIVNHSCRERGIGDYFDIAVIGYGGEEAHSLFGKRFYRVAEVDSMDVSTENVHVVRSLPEEGHFDFFIFHRQWVKPHSKGRTPMGAALRMARTMCAAWCRKNPQSFPPIVINISDGEATDVTPEELTRLADKLKAVATEDGNLLFFNIHLSSDSDHPHTAKWPATTEQLPAIRHAKLLYTISSILPPLYSNAIAADNGEYTPRNYRAVCYNTSCDELVGAMHIGSLSMDRLF